MIKNNRQYKPDLKRGRRTRVLTTLVYIAVIAVALIYAIHSFDSGAKAITWSEFETKMLARQAVERLVIVNGERAEVYIKPAFSSDPYFKQVKTGGSEPAFYLPVGAADVFERRLADAQKNTAPDEKIYPSYVHQTDWLMTTLYSFLFIIFLFGLWYFIIARRMFGGGNPSNFSFGKSTATLIDKQESSITFADVAGLEEAEMEVKEVVDFLKRPDSFTKLGAKIPKGVILVGPPGTGKTLLAKAVAGEAQVPFFSVSGSEFVEMFVGVGASRVRDLFRRAEEKSPCIIFIDEIDAIGRSRGKGAFYTGSNDERESTLNQLLKEMDGFGTNRGVIVLAATNRADMLDAALLRPGRFDRHIYLELPNLKGRDDIFHVHLKGLKLDPHIDTHFLASQTPGFSGADIANICNEAALIAARKQKEQVSQDDFLEAIDRIVAGLEKKSKIISPEERKIVAYHEAGHAVASWLLPHVDPLVKVSIIPRGKALGAAWYLPEEKQLRRQSAFHEHLCATLGGRAAEEVIFGEVSSGALDDLEKATKEAYMMTLYFGFSEKLGHISYYDSTGQHDNSFQKLYSEETGKIVDEEVRRIVKSAYDKTKRILQDNQESLVKIADMLLQKEVILKEDIANVLGERKSPA